MPLFQEDRFYPISGKLIVLSNVSLEPAFKNFLSFLFYDVLYIFLNLYLTPNAIPIPPYDSLVG